MAPPPHLRGWGGIGQPNVGDDSRLRALPTIHCCTSHTGKASQSVNPCRTEHKGEGTLVVSGHDQYANSCSFGTEIVTLKVGSGASMQVFSVHKELLCRKVDYFKVMFDGRWKEGKTMEAVFPEDDPQLFSIFLNWIYFERPLK